jgi:hypothetical protein
LIEDHFLLQQQHQKKKKKKKRKKAQTLPVFLLQFRVLAEAPTIMFRALTTLVSGVRYQAFVRLTDLQIVLSSACCSVLITSRCSRSGYRGLGHLLHFLFSILVYVRKAWKIFFPCTHMKEKKKHGVLTLLL